MQMQMRKTKQILPPILALAQRPRLERLASGRALLAFDFDGTLAPLSADRSRARLRPGTHALLDTLAGAYPVAVITGRSRADVMARLPSSIRRVVGNHGLETDLAPADARPMPELDEARRRLRATIAGAPGVDIEDKGFTLAVHHGRAGGADMHARILDTLAQLESPVRIIPGIDVVNVVPPDAPDKGDALLALMAREDLDQALYVGDDVTDEDVFALADPPPIVTVRVGDSESTAAEHCLADQGEIDALLAALIELRHRS